MFKNLNKFDQFLEELLLKTRNDKNRNITMYNFL